MQFGSRLPSLASVLLLIAGIVVLLVTRGDDGDPDSAPGDPAGESAFAQVIRVVDGDTVVVLIDGREDRVRYIGVDTPESVVPDQPVECFGERAGDVNEALVAGERVRLVFDAELRDRYDRLLAYVYVPDKPAQQRRDFASGSELFVNAELVRRGLARTLEIAPNTDFASLFERLETRAAEAGRGLWTAC